MRPDTVAFISVSLVIILTPGLDMALVARNGLAGGLRAALLTSGGVMVGGMIHATAAIVGLSAILAASATAFSVVRIAGGVYLLYVGIQSLREARRPKEDVDEIPPGSTGPFVTGLVTNVLNPKVAVFFLSLLPGFVAETDAVLARTAQLSAIFLGIAVVWLFIYSVGIARARRVLVRPRSRRIIDTIAGTVLVGLGLRVLFDAK